MLTREEHRTTSETNIRGIPEPAPVPIREKVVPPTTELDKVLVAEESESPVSEPVETPETEVLNVPPPLLEAEPGTEEIDSPESELENFEPSTSEAEEQLDSEIIAPPVSELEELSEPEITDSRILEPDEPFGLDVAEVIETEPDEIPAPAVLEEEPSEPEPEPEPSPLPVASLSSEPEKKGDLEPLPATERDPEEIPTFDRRAVVSSIAELEKKQSQRQVVLIIVILISQVIITLLVNFIWVKYGVSNYLIGANIAERDVGVLPVVPENPEPAGLAMDTIAITAIGDSENISFQVSEDTQPEGNRAAGQVPVPEVRKPPAPPTPVVTPDEEQSAARDNVITTRPEPEERTPVAATPVPAIVAQNPSPVFPVTNREQERGTPSSPATRIITVVPLPPWRAALMSETEPAVDNITDTKSAQTDSDTEEEMPASATFADRSIRVKILNGTGRTGLASRIERRVEMDPSILVTSIGTTSVTWRQTTVYDKQGNPDMALRVRDLLGSGRIQQNIETFRDYDVLIVLGTDFRENDY